MMFTRFYPGLGLDNINYMTGLQIVKYAYGIMSQIEDEMLLHSPSMGGKDAQRSWDSITQTRKEEIWNVMFPATKYRAAVVRTLERRKRRQAKDWIRNMNE